VLESTGLSSQGRKAVATLKPFRDLECKCTTATKGERILNLTLSKIRGEDEEEEMELLVIGDITEYKKAEARYQQLFNDIPVGLYRASPEGKVLDANPALLEILGYPELEALQAVKMAELYVNPEDLARWQELMDRENVVQDFEAQFRRHDGTIIWTRNSARAVKDENGQIRYYEGSLEDITKRKRTEEELRASEQFRRLIIENEPECVKLVGLDGSLIEMNPAGLKMIEANSLDDVKGKPVINLVVPEHRHAFHNLQKKVMEGKSGCLEFEIVGLKGTRRWLETHAVPFRDERNQIIALLGVTRDITEHKQALESLRESEERYRVLFEQAIVPIYIFDPQTKRVLHANPAFFKILGRSPEEIANLYIYDFINHDKESTDHYIEIALRDGSVDIGERIWRKSDGTLLYMNITLSRIEQRGKEFIFVVATDITDSKLAEAEREQLLTAIEQAGESILITDTNGCIQYVNPTFERVTGYTRQEVIGQNPRILKSGKHDEAFYRELWETISSGKIWRGRVVNKRKDGSLYTDETTISPVRNASGEIVNYVAVRRDITKQLLLETQLQQAQRMESVGRLAGGVAHDFNNMLTAIMGYTNLAMSKLDPSHPIRPFLEQIQEAGRRSTDLTRQLLAFARKQTIAPKVLDLNETVASTLKMLRRLIGEDVDLAWMPGANLWSVKIDPAQVDQILTNLCINARDAIAEVGKITIETENVVLDEAYCATHMGFVPGEYVLLAVSDNGCGMDKQTLEKIFEPFFTTKEPGKGTGLGLATVYGIVKQNNGFINVYSEPNKGTTFKIYLPRCLSDAQKIREKKTTNIPKSRGETILLVEDEESILKLGKTMLEELGYTVLTAGTPNEAISIAEKHNGKIHMLITDVIMPEMNGRNLSEKLISLNPNIKCLYMSGYTANAISHRGVLAEGVHFIQKPFSLANLATKVRAILDNG